MKHWNPDVVGPKLARGAVGEETRERLSLLRTAQRGDDLATRELVMNGWDVHERDWAGWTPLHHAVHGACVSRTFAECGRFLRVADALSIGGANLLAKSTREARGYCAGTRPDAMVHASEHNWRVKNTVRLVLDLLWVAFEEKRRIPKPIVQ